METSDGEEDPRGREGAPRRAPGRTGGHAVHIEGAHAAITYERQVRGPTRITAGDTGYATELARGVVKFKGGDEGRVERLFWATHDPLQPAAAQKSPVDLFETEGQEEFGDFVLSGDAPAQLLEPTGLAVDEDERLFVAESGLKRILIYDLETKRLLRFLTDFSIFQIFARNAPFLTRLELLLPPLHRPDIELNYEI